MLISDATNNSSTSILPWLSPVFEDYDFISFIQSEGKPSKYEKHEIITSEYESSQKVIFLTSGLLVSLTTYHELSKPFLISNICIPCTICGYARYLVKHQPPLRTTALCNSEAIAVPFKQLDRYFSKNNKAYNSFMTYCGYCMRSEITSMLAMLTLPAEDKFWILMGAIALHFNIDIKKKWFTIPFKVNREILSGLLYVSLITIDRLINNFTKKNLIYKEYGIYHFSSCEVRKGIDWIHGQ